MPDRGQLCHVTGACRSLFGPGVPELAWEVRQNYAAYRSFLKRGARPFQVPFKPLIFHTPLRLHIHLHGVPETRSEPGAGPSWPRRRAFSAVQARARDTAPLARHQDRDDNTQEWPDRELPHRRQLALSGPSLTRIALSRSPPSTPPMPRRRLSACGSMPARAPRPKRTMAPPTSSSISPSRYGNGPAQRRRRTPELQRRPRDTG